MSVKDGSKKEIERRAIMAARKAGAPIPNGEIPGEEPDFTFHTKTGMLGIEVTELIRSASTNGGIVPAAEETFHQEIIKLAQYEYYSVAGAMPLAFSSILQMLEGKS